MTQQEHLDRIVAKCRELLAVAEKRTPGRWFGGSNAQDAYSCAGWRATIAAIDALDAAHIAMPDGDDTAWMGIEAILAAWPEELL